MKEKDKAGAENFRKARAIFYKNILSMKKQAAFKNNDFFVIVVYFLISYFMIAGKTVLYVQSHDDFMAV